MDFEFNQSSASRVTRPRSARQRRHPGAQGRRPADHLRPVAGRHQPDAVDPQVDRQRVGTRDRPDRRALATGSINTSPIPAADSDGLGAQSRARSARRSSPCRRSSRPDGCTGFGSAYLKSRSSDSFTAALKDFVPPQAVNITNCGTVKIIKKDDAGNALAGAEFTLFKDNAPVGGTAAGAEDTVTTTEVHDRRRRRRARSPTCSSGDYWVVETVTPAGYETAADQHARRLGRHHGDADLRRPAATRRDPGDQDAQARGRRRRATTRTPAWTSPSTGSPRPPTPTARPASTTCCSAATPSTRPRPPGYVGEADKTVTVDNKADVRRHPVRRRDGDASTTRRCRTSPSPSSRRSQAARRPRSLHRA